MRRTYDPERQELVVSLRAIINLAKRAKGKFGVRSDIIPISA
jgi:hypothetical protein